MVASASSNNAETAHPNFGSAYAVAESEIQAGALGTTVMKPGFLQVLDVTLTAAQIIAMYAAPLLLIPAPAAGQSIVIQNALIRMLPTATAFTGGGVVAPQYAATVHGGGTLATSTVAAAVVQGAVQVDTQVGPVAFSTPGLAIPVATGLYLSNATAPFAAGTGTMRVVIHYQVQ